AIGAAFLLSRGVFRDRGLSEGFVLRGLALETVPLLLLGAAALARPLTGARRVALALGLLVAQRTAELPGTYPTLPAATLAPPLPTLASVPFSPSDPCRVVGAGAALRPNGSALYGLEDVRGYESLVLDRFADTYPLWARPQPASYNLVVDLSRPFLSRLNACWAVGAPDDPTRPGWREQARGEEMAIFANPDALPRAFVPRRTRGVADPARRLEELARSADLGHTAWLSRDAPEEANGGGDATVAVRGV